MFLRKSTLDVAGDPNTRDVFKTLAINSVRAAVDALAITPITDNSTGTAAATLEAVATQDAKVVPAANLASRTAFNTAVGKVNNAIAVLSDYLTDNAWTALGFDAPAGFDGVVAVAGTVAACDQTVGAAVDGSAGNAMLRSEFNAAVVRMRNNFSAVVKQYNTLATALGVATIADATGGSSNGTSYDGSANVTAATAVGAGVVAASDLATAAAADAALDSLVDNIGTLATKIDASLLAAATTGAALPVVLIP